MSGINVLVIDDDPAVRRLLRSALEAEGHAVHEAPSLREGETLAGNRRIDLFLIEPALPDGDGVELVRQLRGWTTRPILMLSTRSAEAHKVEALDAGADDYLTKPFGLGELNARIRVALRHAGLAPGGTARLQLGPLTLDLSARQLRRGEASVHLTATQWRLLEVLARQAGRVISARQLLREVWGPGHAEQGHYLRIYVRQLRQKIEPDPQHPRHLLTEIGAGYRLVVGNTNTPTSYSNDRLTGD